MSAIPDDISKTAASVWATLPAESAGITAIARAILAERKRCVEAVHRAAKDFYGNPDQMYAARAIAAAIVGASQ